MESGPIDPNDIEALRRRIAELEAAPRANVSGSSATAQGSGDSLGERSTKVSASNWGTINTGTQTIATQGGAVVKGAVQVRNGHFIGRDFVQIVTHVTQASEDPEETKSVIALYLHALAADLAGLKLGEIDASADQTQQSPLQLADVYVPLNTTLLIPKDSTLAQWLSDERDRSPNKVEAQCETRPVSALEALAEHRELTVLGRPGSGKSTFGASVLLALAQAWQGHDDEIEKLGGERMHSVMFPIRVILRRFAEQLPLGDQPARAGDLWAFIGRDLQASCYGLSGDTMKYVQRIVRHHGALILLDGLDECGTGVKRERVLGAVREFMRIAGEACRFVVTARPYAWPARPDPSRGVYALADLNDAQIEQFIRTWYAALVKRNWRSPGETARKMDDLLQARHRPDLLPLTQNPLLLTLMAILHTNRGRLPEDRADLYNESVDLLMLRWNQQIGADKALLDALAIPGLKLSDLREVLEEVSFTVHEQHIGRDSTADIGENRLVRAFCPLLNNSKDKADLVVDYIEKRAGLLVGQGEKDGERQFTFPHRTFQEFLAACYLAARADFPAECVRLARAAPTHWQVVLPLAARLAKTERGASAADELIGGSPVAAFRARRQPDAVDWACALLAGAQLLEIGLSAINKGARTRSIGARVVDWLVASLPVHPDEGGASTTQRAQAGDVLASLDDPRFDPQCFHLPSLDLLGFMRISADPRFRIGTRRANAQRVATIIGNYVPDYEINDAFTPTSEFYIARYPVTVAQFRAFVEAKKFQIGNASALRDPGGRPVRYISWHEALAYCDWLNEMLLTSPVLEHSTLAELVQAGEWRIALPSELEWELAARGGLGEAVFSWGDKPDPNKANYRESEIRTTSAVGCFPANGFGLYDMIGNVWEWTCSLWGSDWENPEFIYPYDPGDKKREDLGAGNDVFRVVRGGSWRNHPDFARCACRNWDLPGSRNNDVGFRLVLRFYPLA